MMYSYGTPSGTSPAPNGDTTVESEYINCESICDPSPAGPAPQVANGGTFIQNVTIAKLWCVD